MSSTTRLERTDDAQKTPNPDPECNQRAWVVGLGHGPWSHAITPGLGLLVCELEVIRLKSADTHPTRRARQWADGMVANAGFQVCPACLARWMGAPPGLWVPAATFENQLGSGVLSTAQYCGGVDLAEMRCNCRSFKLPKEGSTPVYPRLLPLSRMSQGRHRCRLVWEHVSLPTAS